MKRTVAVQLALVNWRGVFYERYILDPGVTALEGALIVLADHELATSTLAARVAASTRADPYAVVLAGLGATRLRSNVAWIAGAPTGSICPRSASSRATAATTARASASGNATAPWRVISVARAFR